jgi:hypothetical protein
LLSLAMTPQEVESGVMTNEHRQAAAGAILDDGVVVLENVVDLNHVAVLRDKMSADVDALLARPDRPFNWNSGNLQQTPPLMLPYLFRDVLVNDMAIAVWWLCKDSLRFPKGTEEFFNHPLLRTRASFVDGDIDYIRASGVYEEEKK